MTFAVKGPEYLCEMETLQLQIFWTPLCTLLLFLGCCQGGDQYSANTSGVYIIKSLPFNSDEPEFAVITP